MTEFFSSLDLLSVNCDVGQALEEQAYASVRTINRWSRDNYNFIIHLFSIDSFSFICCQ